ncbi:MAG: Fic family protein [Halodesulfurarchaeum sp.]|nr:Fic family protein [Halodesulfurarchaeum sp.]
MERTSLPDIAPGEYRNFGEGNYYIPDELPPKKEIEVSPDIREGLENAIFQLGRLGGIGEEAATSPLLYTTMVRREAVESVLIEGADIDIEELFRPSQIDATQTTAKDVQEALNYETAIQAGAEEVQRTGEITIPLLHRLHETLLEGARDEARQVGEFRRGPIHIPPPSPAEERFIPPPARDVPRLMENLERYIHTGNEYHNLVNCGIVHYQIETIHPYGDGNGRLGRILITLQLIQNEYLTKPLLYPSAYFNKHKVEYVRRMRAVSEEGAWKPWLEFFIRGIAEQAEQAFERTGELRALRREYEGEHGHEKTAADRLAMRLFQKPYVDTKTVVELLDVSDQTARDAIAALEAKGILEETTGKQRYREYKAVDIFAILSNAGI